MERTYHVRAEDKTPLGTFNQTQIKQMAQLQMLRPDMEISADGENWRKASQIKGLFEATQSLGAVSDAPPMPPAPPSSSPSPVPAQLESHPSAPAQTPAESHAAPAAGSGQISPRSIDDLNVSETWKKRFRELEGNEKAQQFNVLAFFFSFFYYLTKGLWKKGLVLLSVAIVTGVVVQAMIGYFGKTLPDWMLGLVTGAIFAQTANLDVYRKERFGEVFWPKAARLDSPGAIFGLLLASVAVVFVSDGLLLKRAYGCSNPEVVGLVKQIIYEAAARQGMQSEEQIKKFAEMQAKVLELTFDGIRETGKSESGETMCAAQVRMVAKAGPMAGLNATESITYGISFTEDGRLWVQTYQ